MPIRTLPLEAITEATVVALLHSDVREDRTLDFKRELNLDDKDGRSELAKDIAAFANTSGGTLLFGVEEGRGEDEGRVVGVPGLRLGVDDTTKGVENVLRDAIDERVMGVRHRAIPRADGSFFYVIRIPPSPLAPHMVTVGANKHRFYLRGGTSNNPMDARQIKEVAVASSTADQRALALVQRRLEWLTKREQSNRKLERNGDDGWAYLHVVPLFPSLAEWDLASPRLQDALRGMTSSNWATYGDLRYAREGLYHEVHGAHHVAFLREGSIEFTLNGIVRRTVSGVSPYLQAWEVEQFVILALDDCARLGGEGLFPAPVLVSLSLSDVKGVAIRGTSSPVATIRGNSEEGQLSLTPFVLHEWSAPRVEDERRLFNELYQSWGIAFCSNYDGQTGERFWFGAHGRTDKPVRAG